MLVLSNGSPKSATTLYNSYTCALLGLDESATVYQSLSVLFANGRLTGQKNFVKTLDKPSMEILYQLSLTQGPLVVKVHLPPSADLLDFLKKPGVFMTYGSRDPRDMLLSAIDHHHRFPDERDTHLFGSSDFRKILPYVKKWSKIAMKWRGTGVGHYFAYTDLLTDPENELRRLQTFLGTRLSDRSISEIISDEHAKRAPGEQRFNKGKLSRYRDEMPREMLNFCNRFLYHELKGQGYPIEQSARVRLDILLQKIKRL
jgi:hypothetical protein